MRSKAALIFFFIAAILFLIAAVIKILDWQGSIQVLGAAVIIGLATLAIAVGHDRRNGRR